MKRGGNGAERKWPWQRRQPPVGADNRIREVLARAGITVAGPLVPTRTRVDVGHWFSNGRLWVGCTADEVVLVAAGARPHLERAPAGDLGRTLYNAVTGEVMLLPATNVRQRHLRLAPVEGWELVQQILNLRTAAGAVADGLKE